MPGVDAKGPDALRPPDSVVAFFVYASAFWALLPLVVRQQIAGGPALYGVLLGAIGARGCRRCLHFTALEGQARSGWDRGRRDGRDCSCVGPFSARSGTGHRHCGKPPCTGRYP